MTEESAELQRWLSTYGKDNSGQKRSDVGAESRPQIPQEEQLPVADTFIIQKRPGGLAGLRRLLGSSNSRTPETAESSK